MDAKQQPPNDLLRNEFFQDARENHTAAHVEIVSVIGGNLVAVRKLEGAVPFFIDSDGTSHVAQEIEVETSSVVGGGGDNEEMNFACEVDLTLSPDSLEPTGQQHSADKHEITILPIQGTSTNNQDSTQDEDERKTVSVGEDKEVKLEGPPEKQNEDKRSMSAEIGNEIPGEERTCEKAKETVVDKDTEMKSEKMNKHMENFKKINDDRSDTQSANEEIVCETQSEEMETEEVNDEELPIRDTCIKYAPNAPTHKQGSFFGKLNVVKPFTNWTCSGASSVAIGSQPCSSSTVCNLATCAQQVRNPVSSCALPLYGSFPVPVCQPVYQSTQQLCCQTCCLISNFWASLPFWITYAQISSCQVPCPTIPQAPVGFEEPPESEWVLANVYHADPSNGALRYKCRNCDGIVVRRSNKQKHNLNYSNLHFQCTICYRRYLTRKQLKIHSLRHSRKTRVCVICDKSFLTQSELQNHLNTHSRQQPYECKICRQRFAHSSRFYTHVKNIHKKYDCNDCYSQICLSSNKRKKQ